MEDKAKEPTSEHPAQVPAPPIIFYKGVGPTIGVRCACSKSRCLRLHCSCFVKGMQCGLDCQCLGCLNNPHHEQERHFVMHYTAKIHSNVFQPLFVQLGEESYVINRKGCKCQKSKCQNRHCECFKNGVACGPRCVCSGCQIKNHEIRNLDLPDDIEEEDDCAEKFRLIIPKLMEKETGNSKDEGKITVVRSKKRKQRTHNYGFMPSS